MNENDVKVTKPLSAAARAMLALGLSKELETPDPDEFTMMEFAEVLGVQKTAAKDRLARLFAEGKVTFRTVKSGLRLWKLVK